MDTQILVNLEKDVRKGQDTGKKVLGIPIEFMDSLSDKVDFQTATLNIGSDKFLKKLPAVDGNSDYYINMNINFSRKITTYYYI